MKKNSLTLPEVNPVGGAKTCRIPQQRVQVDLCWKRRWRESLRPSRARTPEGPVGRLQGSGDDRWDQVYCSDLSVVFALLCSEGWLAGLAVQDLKSVETTKK